MKKWLDKQPLKITDQYGGYWRRTILALICFITVHGLSVTFPDLVLFRLRCEFKEMSFLGVRHPAIDFPKIGHGCLGIGEEVQIAVRSEFGCEGGA